MVCSRCPKECRFYESVLKRKCFKKLKHNVWESKTKWVLIKKADDHLRMKLLYKYINLWMTYLYERYRKKINLRATEAHYEEKLKAKVVAALKKNVERNRMLSRISKRKFECSLKYRCWHQWKHYVQKRLKVREVKVLADRIRQERLRIRFFYMWLFSLNEKRLLKDGYKLAVVKHETKLKEKCFKYWKIFTKKQICKTKIQKLAIACYKDKLKEKYIRCWKKYTYQKKQYKHQVSVIRNFYETYLMKNYLNQWWIAYRNLEHKNQIYKFSIAVSHHERKLLEKGFKTLWKVLTVKKSRDDKARRFREIYLRNYVSFYLGVWEEKRKEKIVWNVLENKATEWREDHLRELFLSKLLEVYQERIAEREELENVVKYSNAIVIHRAFRGWREVTNYKTQKKIHLENASRIYTEKLLKKSFDKWKRYVLKRHRKKMAVEYYKFVLLLRVVTEWKIFLKKRKLKLAEAVILEGKHNMRLLKNALDCWKNETRISKLKLNAAICFHDRQTLSKAFSTWRRNTLLKTVNKSRFTRNKSVLNDITIKNIIFHWHKLLSVSQNIQKKLQECRKRQEKRSLSSCFHTWYRFLEKKKCLHQNAVAFAEIRSEVLLERYLIMLSEAVISKRIYNRKEELAEKVEEKLLKRRYMRKWLSFIRWKREKIERCVSDERKNGCEFFIPVGRSTRRQPMIPGYLRAEFVGDQFQEEDTINQETYRVERPVNKNIPIIGHRESFVSFEV